MKKYIYIIVGCLCLVLGAVGTILPILPTVPFFLGAAWCFARSSQRLHAWFVGTKLYQENLASYVAGEGMTLGAKLRIMGTVTVLMGAGFWMMDAVPVGRAVLAAVWLLHVLYFGFRVKTREDA